MAETKGETGVINALVNAIEKHRKAATRYKHHEGDERAFYAEQYTRLSVTVARDRMYFVLKVTAWNEGHETVCGAGKECQEHINPYAKELAEVSS